MLKTIFAIIALVATIAVTGCSGGYKTPAHYNPAYTSYLKGSYPDLTITDKLITKGKSTIDDVRRIYGTPNYIALTLKTNRLVYAYSFVPEDIMKGRFNDLKRAAGVFGISRNAYPNTNKVIYFVFDKDQVYDFKYRGFAHVQFFRTDEYYEAFQILTDEEYKDSKFYTEDEIYQMYAQKLAKRKGVDVSQLTEKEIHKRTKGAPTFMFISYDNCSKVLGEGIKVLFNDPKPLYGDGVDSSLLLYNQPKK